MTKRDEQLKYSCIIFYSLAISFLILSIVNIFYPISNFKMTVLSVVALLLSLQQLCEAREEIDKKIADLETNAMHQGELLELIDHSDELPSFTPGSDKAPSLKSRWILAVAMIILIVGLTLDFDFQNGAIANTLTIVSFAVIFFTMGYKERFATRINLLNEGQHETNRKIIAKLKEQINTLEKTLNRTRG